MFMAPHPSPYLLFLTEVTNSSPRNYAIALCIDQYGVKGVFVKEKVGQRLLGLQPGYRQVWRSERTGGGCAIEGGAEGF